MLVAIFVATTPLSFVTYNVRGFAEYNNSIQRTPSAIYGSLRNPRPASLDRQRRSYGMT